MGRSVGIAILFGILGLAIPLPATEAPHPPEITPVRPPSIPLPKVIDGSPVRQYQQQNNTIHLDLSNQTIQLELPKIVDWRQKGKFSRGDLVQVKRSSSLRSKSTVLASLRAGQQLTVSDVHTDGKWVEAGAVSKGNAVRGWLSVDDVEFVAVESPLEPSLRHVNYSEFASAAVLAQKAKQFDDGLMATVQLAAQNGRGKFVGKAAFLDSLAKRMSGQESADLLVAACVLGKIPVQVPPARKSAVNKLMSDFLGREVLSKPLAFYTWSSQLTALFQQDRLLQTDLAEVPGADIVALARALRAEPSDRRAYEEWLTLQARLTNPQVVPDLRPVMTALDAGQTPQVVAGTKFFPPSSSQETAFLRRMFPDGIVPPDFQLMDELVKRIKSGSLDLKPQPDAGWYDQQVWALEPYLRPERMPEGSRWSANKEYHDHLTKLFKGMWALTRETHIKDVEIFPAAAAERPFEEPEPKIKISVQAQISAEPIATSYLRRAMGYRFLRQILTEQFGEDALKQLWRLTIAGPVKTNLDDELRQMEGLFNGAYVTVTRQLGLVEQDQERAGSGAGADADAQAFLAWAANLHRDPDLSTDVRMMVPVYFDVVQNKTKVWAFLGWTTQAVHVSFGTTPKVSVTDKDGKSVPPERLEISYHGNSYEVSTPVFQELFVSKILNRDEFRKHCDAYGSAAAIVKNLE